MSLLGALDAGWYVPTEDSFYLLSFNGKFFSSAQIAALWPEKVELFEKLATNAGE
jgi:hypothetical protein